MTDTNRFYTETFTAAIGSLASGAQHNTQYESITTGFKRVQDELDLLAGIGGITDLDGFPASFAGAALKYLRVNAAESAVEFVTGGNVNIKSIGGTSYTLLATDPGSLLIFTNADPITVTVPVNTLAQGDVVCLLQGGAGRVTLTPAANVSLNSSDDLLATRTQYAQVAVVCDDATTDANVFHMIGERNAPTLNLPNDVQMSCSDLTTSISTGTSVAYHRARRPMTISGVRASLLTASTSGAVTVDINLNGSTILSTKLTIDQDEKTSVTAATAAVLSATAVADDDEITVDIDGAGTGAKGLIVTLIGTLA